MIWSIAIAGSVFLDFSTCSGQQENDQPDVNRRANVDPQDEVPGESSRVDKPQTLDAEQRQLAEKYRLLEEKLFSLHEFEKGGNPTRSKLLARAFRQSQSNMTAAQMNRVVTLLTNSKLKAAEDEQKRVLTELNDLLNLLQSEDRGKRLQDEIQRHQAYLKEVERILRIQKGIRGQAEGGVDGQRLANSQIKTADRTRSLADEIRKNEENGESENNQPAVDNPADQARDNNGEQPSGDQRQSGRSDKNPDANPSPAGGNPQRGNGQNPSGNQEPENNAPNENQMPDLSPQQSKDPTRSRLQAAEQRMRDAQQKLDSAKRRDAIEAMRQAEREMSLAKKELEEILRQLREEEVERTLAKLEGRFRQMLEREVRVLGSTQKLDRIVAEQRGTEFEIKAGKLGLEQNSIATEAARALLLLREDGSSVAFPATVDEMHQDMLQVASRLSAAKIGRISIELEEDVVDTLKYLIDALVQTQRDAEKMKKQQPAKAGGQPQDQPLVNQLAEIKMLRGLQERVFRRHSRYSRFLDDPDDPIGGTADPDLRSALLRLAEKQEKLTEIARDIVNEKNK